MAGELKFEGTGLLCRGAEMRFTPSGAGVVKFTLMVGPSRKNEQGEWEKYGDPYFHDCEAWGELAEEIADFAPKSVLDVRGIITMRTYEKEGQKRTFTTLKVFEASLKFPPREQSEQSSGGGWASGPVDDSDSPPF